MAINQSDDPEIDPEQPSAEELAELAQAGFQSVTEKVSNASVRHLWLISYADFMTILMIFFLALYGYTYLAKAALLKLHKDQTNYGQFTERVQDMKKKLGDHIKVQDDVDKIVVQVSDTILFPSGSASLSAEAAPTLEELAKSIKLIDGEVIVQGHTDNVPIRSGRFKSNWELSTTRAFSVITALTDLGVSQERLAAWGFGENRPVAENVTPEGRAKNRRIDVVILKKKEKTEAKNGV